MEVPNTFFDLFLGYTVVFVLLSVFVLKVSMSQARLRREIEVLRKAADTEEPPQSERAVH